MAMTQFPPTTLEPRVFCKTAQMFISLTTARSFLPTHQPILREKQTQIPNICQVLPFFLFLPLANWMLSCPAHHLFSDLPGHTFRSSQPRVLNIAYTLPEPTLLCIQQSPQAPYQNITAYWGHSAARDYKSFPVWTDLQISQLSKLKATDSLI